MKLYLLKDNNNLSENGYSLVEQDILYSEQLRELYNNPRWYLENLDYMVEYRVGWVNYRYKNPVLPRKSGKKEKGL